jgi:membrane-associated protein
LFLPGDSLLFTVGVVAGAGELNIIQICVVLAVASVLGDQCGYFLGRRTGPAIFSRPDSRWFKQEYVTRTQRFYERHGGKTLIYAKFVPVVRAFAPYMAGVGRMSYVRFLSFNVWGGLGWVLSMTLGGYVLGNYPFIRRNFEKVVLGIVFLSIVPLIIQILHSRRSGSDAVSPEAVPETPE